MHGRKWEEDSLDILWPRRVHQENSHAQSSGKPGRKREVCKNKYSNLLKKSVVIAKHLLHHFHLHFKEAKPNDFNIVNQNNQ